MDRDETTHAFGDGGCGCGAVRFRVEGAPLRVGICHCMDCRKAFGAAFNAFAIYPVARVEVRGTLSAWLSSPDYERRFCPACGSRLCGGFGDEMELPLGSFDTVGRFTPMYESWVSRREPWLAPLDVLQNAHNLSEAAAEAFAARATRE